MSFSKEMGQLEGLIGQAHQYISNKEHRWRQGRNARGGGKCCQSADSERSEKI